MGTRYPVSGAVSAAASLNFYNEFPTGLINGVNTTFTLAHPPRTPLADNVVAFQNGLLLQSGIQYTVSGVTVTFALAPEIGDTVNIIYVALV